MLFFNWRACGMSRSACASDLSAVQTKKHQNQTKKQKNWAQTEWNDGLYIKSSHTEKKGTEVYFEWRPSFFYQRKEIRISGGFNCEVLFLSGVFVLFFFFSRRKFFTSEEGKEGEVIFNEILLSFSLTFVEFCLVILFFQKRNLRNGRKGDVFGQNSVKWN